VICCSLSSSVPIIIIIIVYINNSKISVSQNLSPNRSSGITLQQSGATVPFPKYMFTTVVHTETREGWPLLTVETREKGLVY
jgi:hypothetical protein